MYKKNYTDKMLLTCHGGSSHLTMTSCCIMTFWKKNIIKPLHCEKNYNYLCICVLTTYYKCMLCQQILINCLKCNYSYGIITMNTKPSWIALNISSSSLVSSSGFIWSCYVANLILYTGGMTSFTNKVRNSCGELLNYRQVYLEHDDSC